LGGRFPKGEISSIIQNREIAIDGVVDLKKDRGLSFDEIDQLIRVRGCL